MSIEKNIFNLSKEIIQPINKYDDVFPKFGVFKILDYDLNLDERKMKFKKYNYVLCEDCYQEIESINFVCYNCYNKETDYNERNRMYNGICKSCFKSNTSNGCSICNIFKSSDYNLYLKKRKAKYKEFNNILCEKCNQINEYLNDCLSCNSKQFQRDFDKWTSGNVVIDKLIQDNQLSVRRHGLLEWIPYYKFTNITYIAEGGFANVYSAIWSDGQIMKWNQLSQNWRRNGSTTIALKVLNNSEKISEDFLNEIKFFNEVSGYTCIINCFGITQDPITCNYALVLQYMEYGDLRKYLERTVNLITWNQRLNKIYDICLALSNIHVHGLIHKDLHPGNIFIDSTCAYIGDIGLCMPANEILSNSTRKNIYGVMPYIAPEILRGKPHTLASDVYSLGVIINEIITVIPPFNNQPHDHYLALDICRGLRPNIREETPNSLKELIEKSWDANPEHRPTSGEIFHTLSYHLNAYKSMPLKKLLYNFNESTNITDLLLKVQLNENESTNIHPQAIYTSRLLNFQNLPEPINCPNQQKFISSRYIKKIQTGLNSDECSDCIIMDID